MKGSKVYFNYKDTKLLGRVRDKIKSIVLVKELSGMNLADSTPIYKDIPVVIDKYIIIVNSEVYIVIPEDIISII